MEAAKGYSSNIQFMKGSDTMESINPVEQYDVLYNIMEGFRFQGLEEYNMAKVLSTYLPSLFLSKNFKRQWLPRCLWHIMHANYEYDFSRLGKGKILFFISENIRKDHLGMFHKMKSCAENTDELVGEYILSRKLNFTRFRTIPLIISWFRELSKKELPFSWKMSLIGEMVECAIWVEQIKHHAEILLAHRALVVANEAMPRENLLVQFFNKHDIPTASMQHGHYNATRYIDQNRFEIGAAYRASVCNMFLAWGQYSKLEAEMSGILAQRIYIVGCPKYIDEEEIKISGAAGRFGAILCGTDEFNRTDEEILECAERFYQATGMKYVVKPHPSVRNTVDALLARKQGVVRICANDESVIDYAKTVQFSICAGSTVYAELLRYGCIAYRYTSKTTIDRYMRVQYGTFSTADELIALMKQNDGDTIALKRAMREIRAMIFGTMDEREAYTKAFLKLPKLKGNIEHGI